MIVGVKMDVVTDIDEAARLLDVNLVSLDDDWSGGIGQSQFFRIPAFGQAFAALEARRTTFSLQFVIQATELAFEISRDSQPRGWCEDSYTQRQLDLAIRGQPMRFDKAVVSVLTLNGIARTLKKEPMPEHSIVCCAFRFPELPDLVTIAARDQMREAARRDIPLTEEGAREHVLQHLQAATKQRRIFIDKLLNKMKSKSGRREVEVTASYPTMRALYKALKAYPSLRHRFVEEPREGMIPLRRRRDHVASAVAEELVESGRVDRPPYGWDSEAGGSFPAEIDPGQPFEWMKRELRAS